MGDEADPFDICRCGDYRHQHDERGACRLNGLGHGGAGPCRRFERSETAAHYRERHGLTEARQRGEPPRPTGKTSPMASGEADATAMSAPDEPNPNLDTSLNG